MQFASFGLSPAILRALREEAYAVPTPIQAQTIGPALAGRDVLGCAQTGTGKTAAFALPLLHRVAAAAIDKSRRGPGAPRALVLSPTRELAGQIGESFVAYGRHTGLRQALIFGGVSPFHQVKALQRGVDILVATPGRLIDLMDQGLADLSAVSVFVLDEADRMLDMGFIKPIRRIAAALPPSPARQTLLFSATMPRAIMHLADSLLHDPVRVTVEPVAATTALIRESVYRIARAGKPALLKQLLAARRSGPGGDSVARALVFTRTKRGAERLSRELNQAGITCDAIHGDKGQNQRRRALDAFRTGRVPVLIATDVAARGLDVDGVTHIFNYDMPIEPETYVHRIGRTGRAGASGVAISFCAVEEQDLLRAIERLLGRAVPLAAAGGQPAQPQKAAGRSAPARHASRRDGDPRPERGPARPDARPLSQHRQRRRAVGPARRR